jgi:uncharacterized protein (UPF0333 family)
MLGYISAGNKFGLCQSVYIMKGQASVEFLLIFSLLAVIFVIALSYYLNYGLSSNAYLSEENYHSICLQVENEIDSALSAGPYYERDFYIEQGPYNVSVSGYEIKVNYSSGAVSCRALVNVSKNLSIGKNTIIYNGTGFYFT